MKQQLTIGFLSLGLIGGSIAKAIRKYHPDYTLLAYNRSKDALKEAMEDGIIDFAMDSPCHRIEECDIIFLCAPIVCNLEYLKLIKENIKPEAIVTDVGSVKTNIHEKVSELSMDSVFIGGHPMAGSEKTGYSNASASILENSYYILTPTAETTDEKMQFMEEFIASLKTIPIRSDYHTHDYATAAISHVPHLIAASLVELVEENDSPDQFMKLIAAGGFKDITRIASSSPVMWQHICQSNDTNIIRLLSLYEAQLEEVKQALVTKNYDYIGDLFQKSGSYRNSLNDNGKSSISKNYQLYMDINDETGAIAKVAGCLAKENINIKNIGITHNREHQEGVLYIVFYDETSVKNAIPILQESGYHVFE